MLLGSSQNWQKKNKWEPSKYGGQTPNATAQRTKKLGGCPHHCGQEHCKAQVPHASAAFIRMLLLQRLWWLQSIPNFLFFFAALTPNPRSQMGASNCPEASVHSPAAHSPAAQMPKSRLCTGGVQCVYLLSKTFFNIHGRRLDLSCHHVDLE